MFKTSASGLSNIIWADAHKVWVALAFPPSLAASRRLVPSALLPLFEFSVGLALHLQGSLSSFSCPGSGPALFNATVPHCGFGLILALPSAAGWYYIYLSFSVSSSLKKRATDPDVAKVDTTAAQKNFLSSVWLINPEVRMWFHRDCKIYLIDSLKRTSSDGKCLENWFPVSVTRAWRSHGHHTDWLGIKFHASGNSMEGFHLFHSVLKQLSELSRLNSISVSQDHDETSRHLLLSII